MALGNNVQIAKEHVKGSHSIEKDKERRDAKWFPKSTKQRDCCSKDDKKSILPTILPPTVITASCFPKEELKLL